MTCRLAAAEGGPDLRNSDDSWLWRLALPLSAPSVQASGCERNWYVARDARYIPIQWPSAGSKVLERERDHKTAVLAQAGERHDAMADSRPHGGANDGAVLGDGKRISGALVSPSQPPSHVLTPLTFPRDGVGARRSSQPSMVVVLAPLQSSGAAERSAQTSGADGRGGWLCGRRAGRMLCSLVMAPRSRCVAVLSLWCMVHGAEDCCKRPPPTGPNRTLLCGQECCFGAFGGVWNACIKRNTKSSYAWPPAAAASRPPQGDGRRFIRGGELVGVLWGDGEGAGAHSTRPMYVGLSRPSSSYL